MIGEKFPRTFCYPYGGPVAHNIDTIKILTELNCLFTVDVNYHDCDSEIIAKHAQELPRWDCNKFFSGSCRNSHTYTRDLVPHDYGRPSTLITKAQPKFRSSKITLFTGHQPRHLALVHRLAEITDTLYVVHEVAGSVSTRRESDDAVDTYFAKVHEAELKYFGGIRFTPANVRTMSILSGDASVVPLETYGAALDAEVFVVFGASFLKVLWEGFWKSIVRLTATLACPRTIEVLPQLFGLCTMKTMLIMARQYTISPRSLMAVT